jgi:hypothetical protein
VTLLGLKEGKKLGLNEGKLLGFGLGFEEGEDERVMLGLKEGDNVGCDEGNELGEKLGPTVGLTYGVVGEGHSSNVSATVRDLHVLPMVR